MKLQGDVKRMLTNLYKRLCGFDSVREVSCYYDYGFCVEGARVVD